MSSSSSSTLRAETPAADAARPATIAGSSQGSSPEPDPGSHPGPQLTRSKLLLHDTLVFLALLAIAVALFGVTLFLFRSFEAHRENLARSSAVAGEQALREDKPALAIQPLRAALSYSPDDRADQLLLARALAGSGHTQEATAYFLNLWSTRPGDGFINLQLARLARQRGDAREAADYYRAAILGAWEGDGLLRRRDARLELTDYLVSRGDTASARAELLIAAGNAPANATANLVIADRLAVLDDLPDALTIYRRSAADDPENPVPLARAGEASLRLGEYDAARKLFDESLHLAAHSKAHAAGESTAENTINIAEIEDEAHRATRLRELSLSRDLPAEERARHVVLAATIAQLRLHACMATTQIPLLPSATPAATTTAATTSAGGPTAGGLTAPPPTPLQALAAQWKPAQPLLRHPGALAQNDAAEDGITQLIFQTEAAASSACGAPAGDDALLLALAKRSASAGNGGSQ